MAIYHVTSCFSMHKVPYAPGSEIELTEQQAERFLRAKLVAEKPTIRKQPRPVPKSKPKQKRVEEIEEPVKPKRRKTKTIVEPVEIEIEDVDS